MIVFTSKKRGNQDFLGNALGRKGQRTVAFDNGSLMKQ